MNRTVSLTGLLAAAVCLALHLPLSASACCPAPPSGKPVINADQTVIIVWDAAAKMQHFIRRASFKSEAEDFGFLVPTPSRPELNESGNEAFPYLQRLTAPVTTRVPRPRGGMGCGCAEAPAAKSAGELPNVEVVEEKLVAGFNAVVLQAESAEALINWLEDHGYAFSPEVQEWAEPYVQAGWKITALKIAKDAEGAHGKDVSAAALRMSFQTDQPLFPYREPDMSDAAGALRATDRLLRIYFLAEARYQGELTQQSSWTGEVSWADKLTSGDRKKVLELLGVPEDAAPAECWLTEFEDHWPYRPAPTDLHFARNENQGTVKRPPIIEYVSTVSPPDVMGCALIAVVVGAPLLRLFGRWRRAWWKNG